MSYTQYGKYKFCSSLYHENIFATQFHPEKSGKNGLKIFKEFKDIFKLWLIKKLYMDYQVR